MIKRSRKLLSRVFARRMAERFPQFEPEKATEASGGIMQYRWDPASGLSFFLVMQPYEKTDDFTLEAGWSVKGRYPWNNMAGRPVEDPVRGIPPDSPKDGEFRFRIGELWPPHDEKWWRTSRRWGLGDPFDMSTMIATFTSQTGTEFDFTEQEMEGVVREALDSVERYVVPYFEDTLRRHEEGSL
jgi:hypothetical protein